jgi:hypothetical protein
MDARSDLCPLARRRDVQRTPSSVVRRRVGAMVAVAMVLGATPLVTATEVQRRACLCQYRERDARRAEL